MLYCVSSIPQYPPRLRCQKISLICPELIPLIGSLKVPSPSVTQCHKTLQKNLILQTTFGWVDGYTGSVQTLFIFPILISQHSSTGQDGQQGPNGHSSSPIFCGLFAQDMSEEQTETNGRNVKNALGHNKTHIKEQIGRRQKGTEHHSQRSTNRRIL